MSKHNCPSCTALHIVFTGTAGMLCFATLFDFLGIQVFWGAVLGFALGGWLALYNEKKDAQIKND